MDSMGMPAGMSYSTSEADRNRIISVVQIAEGEDEKKHQSLSGPTILTTVASSVRSSAVILQQGYVAHLQEHFEAYPMACLPIANKPLIAH